MPNNPIGGYGAGRMMDGSIESWADGGDGLTMDKMFLRKKDLVDRIGMARGTISDWLNEYHMFMPTTRHGNITLYKPETINVLYAVKEIKESGYMYKTDIIPQLLKRGFVMTVEDGFKEMVQPAFSQADTRDPMVKVIMEISRQDERLGMLEQRTDEWDGRLTEHAEMLDGQDGRIKELEQKLLEMEERMKDAQREASRQITEALQEAAAAKAAIEAERRRSVWSRLFLGGK